jgi:GTP cyclohydrolase IA
MMAATATANGGVAVRPSAGHAEQAVRVLLAHLGYDCTDAGMADTPGRVVRALTEMTAGRGQDPAIVLARTFPVAHGSDHDELIAQTGIEFTAMCEHHLMPFTGIAAVAYIPRPHAPVVGLSKLARLVDIYARRLTMQERMTRQITAALDTHLDPLGSACIIRSTHACMGLRGVRKPTATTITSSLTGILRDNSSARGELLTLIGGSHG